MGIYVNLQVMMESEYIIEHKVHTKCDEGAARRGTGHVKQMGSIGDVISSYEL